MQKLVRFIKGTRIGIAIYICSEEDSVSLTASRILSKGKQKYMYVYVSQNQNQNQNQNLKPDILSCNTNPGEKKDENRVKILWGWVVWAMGRK